MKTKRDQKQIQSFSDLKKHFKADKHYNTPNIFGVEGEDHINLSIQSNVFLGKLFSLEYIKTISYPYLGNFSSVMSLWYWIKSDKLDDNLRRLNGAALRSYVTSRKAYGDITPNFKAIIAYATWLKIKNHQAGVEEIKKLDTNKIKFLSYTTVQEGGLRLSTKFAAMLVEIANECVAAIKGDREPDFGFMVTDPKVAGLQYAEGVLLKVLPVEKIEEMKNPTPKVEQPESVEEEVEEIVVPDLHQ